MWVSDEPWSDITYHYGRWVYDPEEGWLWIPGYVWAPAWVIWREGGDYLGWFPMPPDYGDFDDGPYYGGHYGWDDYYGYRSWYRMDQDRFFSLWIFVDHEHFARRDYRSFAIGPDRARDVIRRTSDSTRYAMSGDRIVNRSVPNDRIERAMHHRIEAAPAHRFLRGDVPMVPSSAGRDIARHEHEGGRGPGGGERRRDEGGAGPFGGPPQHDRGQRDWNRSDDGDRSRHLDRAAPPLPQPPSAQPPLEAGPKHFERHGGEKGAPPQVFEGAPPDGGPKHHEQRGDGDNRPPPQMFERPAPPHGNSGGPPHDGGHPNGPPPGESQHDQGHGHGGGDGGKPDHGKGQQD
jgi:hypothetical protein